MDRPIIYAVDFDGTLCENRWPDIGDPNIPLITFLKGEQAKGNKVVLWTMREGALLDNALVWLMGNHLFLPDAVNDNLPLMVERYKQNSRKVFADVYIDDRNAKFGVCAELPFGATRED